DALAGRRGNSFMQQAAARGIQSAGESGGGAGMAFLGMGMNAAGGAASGLQQPAYQQQGPPQGYQQGYPPQGYQQVPPTQGYRPQGYQQGYQQGTPPP